MFPTIEEAMKTHGYDDVPGIQPVITASGLEKGIAQIGRVLDAVGLTEAVLKETNFEEDLFAWQELETFKSRGDKEVNEIDIVLNERNVLIQFLYFMRELPGWADAEAVATHEFTTKARLLEEGNHPDDIPALIEQDYHLIWFWDEHRYYVPKIMT